MAEHNRMKLLAHPLCKRLAKRKFHSCGVWMFYFSFLFYFTFIGIFTSIAVRMEDPETYYNNLHATFDNVSCENVSQAIEKGLSTIPGMKESADKNLRIALYVLLCLLLGKNLWSIFGLIQVSLAKALIFLPELGAMFLSFVFIFDEQYQKNVNMRCPVQWQYGAFGLLIGYLGLLYYIQYIPFIGIYVIMLKIIFIRFIFFLPVLMCLIFGFGIAFHMLLQYRDAFESWPRALSEISIV
jgi:hypothetical protein